MSRVRTGAVSESGIVFFSSGGHDHNGINSSIIDTSKYSIFDFGFGLVGTNRDRVSKQTINQIAFKDYIIKTVNESVLEPAGVVLQDNIINSRNIIAGSITSAEIAANTITSNNIAANTITGAQIAANTITADKLQVGAISAGSVTIANNGVPNGDFWSSNGSFRLGGANGVNYTGTTINLGSNTVITGSVDIGGPDNDSLQIDTNGALWIGHRSFGSAPFRVYANGRVIAGNGGVDISTSGSLGVTGSTIVGGNLTVNGPTIGLGGAGSTTTVSGTLQVNGGTTVSGGLTVNGTTQINGGLTFSSGIGTIQMQSNVSITGSISTTGSVSIGSGTVTISAAGDITRPGVWSLTSAGFTTPFGISIGSQIVVFTGSPSNPAFTFTGATSDGLYRDTSGALSVTLGGQQRAAFGAADTIVQITATGTAQAVSWTAFGLVKAASTRNIKDNINYFSNGIEKIKNLKPVTFTYKPTDSDSEYVAELKKGAVQHGFIAEEIADADHQLAVWDVPDISDLDEDQKVLIMKDLSKYIPVYYNQSGILSITVAAIKELAARVEALEQELGYNS